MKRYSIQITATLFLWSMMNSTQASATDPNVIPIATARAEPVKTVVEVEGVAIITPGTFDEGFAIQDSTGGIYVTSPMGKTIVLGDRVHVVGKITAPNKEIWLDPSTVIVESSGPLQEPLVVETGQVGRNTEGNLITVTGKITSKVKRDWPWGWKFTINDGSGDLQVFIAAAIKMKIFISPKKRIDVAQLHVGQVLRVTGFNGRYQSITEILPRAQADIMIEKN
jgi:uncharacterized protein YdeI (BOF family)